MDLLSLKDLAPPMGDTAFAPTLATGRALWTAPIEGEDSAPERRIIHGNLLQLHGDAKLHRLGLGRTPGYHKCGSVQDLDWVRAFRLLAFDGQGWNVVRRETECPTPDANETIWFDLNGVIASTLLIEVRESGIDRWWTSWNLASGGFVLDGEVYDPPAPRSESVLTLSELTVDGLPNGVSAVVREGEVRYRTRTFEVGFWMNRAAMAFLALNEDGVGDGSLNLLRTSPGYCFQGPQLHPVGGPPLIAPALRNAIEGTTEVRGNHVSYLVDVQLPGNHSAPALKYRLTWEILDDRLVLHAECVGVHDLRLWNGCVWQFGFDATVAPVHVLGSIIRAGQTGLMNAPAWVHVPGGGSFRLEAAGDPVRLRSEAIRRLDLATLEINVGTVPSPFGDYVLPAGRHQATIEMRVEGPEIPLRADAPKEIQRAVQTCGLTALTYRADTATFSNNGVSIHCPISMDNWSAITTRMGALLPKLNAIDLFRDSMERWLDGGPGYTSGRIMQSGAMHEVEEEYVMTGAACLLGLADYLNHSGTSQWLDRYADRIRDRITRTRALDVDDDGLIESRYRTGVSGTGQWSTCWFDVISFGWKDAFSNALLYGALVRLTDSFEKLDRPDLSDGLDEWAEKLKTAFVPTFFNPDTGWLAGWRCKEERLHDYGFLFVNGAAVCSGVLEEDLASGIIPRLWDEAQRLGLPDAYLGLPGNLHHIPDDDLADIMQGYPLGFYQNGGRTHAQSRHFVGALYSVGMTNEAEGLLRRLCAGMADGAVYGGCRSGRDWRFWDGRPCGYEGLLTDQFGILAVALERYGKGTP